MSNGTWKRSTTASRRAERRVRYLHVSVQVTPKGAVIPQRTPKGKGSTATNIAPEVSRMARKAQKRENSGLVPAKTTPKPIGQVFNGAPLL